VPNAIWAFPPLFLSTAKKELSSLLTIINTVLIIDKDEQKVVVAVFKDRDFSYYQRMNWCYKS